MRLRWTRFALQDLRHLYECIVEDNPAAASRTVSRIQEASQILKTHPEMGRAGRSSGIRELVIAGTPYIVVYLIQGDEIQIVAVIHGAMKWPDSLDT